MKNCTTFLCLLFASAALAAPPLSGFTVGDYKIGISRHYDNINVQLGYGKRSLQLAGGVWYELYDREARKSIRGETLPTNVWEYAKTPKGAQVSFVRTFAHGPATNRTVFGSVLTVLDFAEKEVRVKTTATPAFPGKYSFQPQAFSQQVYLGAEVWQGAEAVSFYRNGEMRRARLESPKTFYPGSWSLETSQLGPQKVEFGLLDTILTMTAGDRAGFNSRRWAGLVQMSCAYEKADLMYPEPWTAPVTWEFTINMK